MTTSSRRSAGNGRLGAFLLGAALTLAAVGVWHFTSTEGEEVGARVVDRGSTPRSDSPLRLGPADARPPAAADAPGDVVPIEAQPTPLAASNPHNPDDPTGIVVFGTVTEPDGTLLDVATNWLWFRSPEGRQVGAPLSEDSAYAAPGLSPGEWTVQATIRGYRPLETTLTLTGDQALVRHDIVIEPAQVLLVAVVKPDGEPITLEDFGIDGWDDPLSVIATLQRPTADLPPISHRIYSRHGVGHYIAERDGLVGHDDPLPEGYRGRLELDASPPLWAGLLLRHVLVTSQRIEPGDDEVVFVVRPEQLQALLGEVVFRVVDAETGEPLPDASAELSDSQSSGPHRRSDPPGSGSFRFANQRPGLLELSLYAKEHESAALSVDVAAGRVTDLGDLALDPATTISGVILDGDDQPVATTFRLYPYERFTEDAWIWSRRYNQSDAEGRFSRSWLGRDRYLLSVRTEAWAAPPLLVDSRAGDVTDLVVRVSPSTRVYVTHEHAEDRSLRVDLWASDGLPVTTWTRAGGQTVPLVLAPGTYRYVLSDEGSEVGSGEWTVGSEPMTVTVRD